MSKPCVMTEREIQDLEAIAKWFEEGKGSDYSRYLIEKAVRIIKRCQGGEES